MEIAKKHTEKLEEIEKKINLSYDTNRKNADRYNLFMRFVFETAINQQKRGTLNILHKPPLEFNILEAAISSQMGDFAKHEPTMMARAADGARIQQMTPEFMEQLNVLQWHLSEIFCEAANDGLQYNFFRDMMGGGFTVGEVSTDYVNPMSFEQKIIVERVFDPSLCGFDPMAVKSHKGDGGYCFKLVPKTKEDFESIYGTKSTKGLKFYSASALGEFQWQFTYNDLPIILTAEFYQKKNSKVKIVKLTNGHTVQKKRYEDFCEQWAKAGYIEQPPQILEERWTVLPEIERYTMTQNQILEYKPTSYSMLPLVWGAGNSVTLKEGNSGSTYEMTRPYVYNAMGVQELMNFSGQTVAAEIEGMVAHKIKVPLEAIPKDFQHVYQNVQQADTLVYNQFLNGDPNVRLDPPMEIQRTPTPPIVENTFMGTSKLTQMILGNLNMVQGTNDNNVSGRAIGLGAIQANSAAAPYMVGYIKFINRIAEIVVDLIPKFYVTPRSIPIRKADGKRSYKIINDPTNKDSISMMYDPNSVQIKVEAGVNLEIQKTMALDQCIKLIQTAPVFANFMGSEGLETILDNLDIRGIEGLKEKVPAYLEKMQKMQEEAAKKGDPMVEASMLQTQAFEKTEMAKIEQSQLETEGAQLIQAAKVAVEKQKVEILYAKTMAEVADMETKQDLEAQRIAAEDAKTAVELAIKFGAQITTNH
jgi:uncharacterized protein YegP (UPF0339 family)